MEKETMVATVPQAEIVDEQQLSRDVTDIEFQAESLVIQTDEDYAFAGEFGKMLKKKASQVTTFFKPMKDSAYQAHKAVCDREKAMLTPLRNAEKTVKQVMSAYIAEQERKRREAEEAARRKPNGNARFRKRLLWKPPVTQMERRPPLRKPPSWMMLQAMR